MELNHYEKTHLLPSWKFNPLLCDNSLFCPMGYVLMNFNRCVCFSF